MASRRITVVGSSNADLIMKVPHLPARGETVTDGQFFQVFGGKGANQAVAAARAGGDVAFVTCLGTDDFGAQAKRNFAADGIDVGDVKSVSDAPTGAALIMFDGLGQNYLAVAPGANYRLQPQDIRPELIADSAMVVMQMEIPTPTILEVLRLCQQQSVPVLLNYAPVRDGSVPVSREIAILVVNENEAEALGGVAVVDPSSAVEAATILRGLGPATVIVTLGTKGSVIVSAEGSTLVPARPVQPVDTTAAGDVYCGALAVALVEGLDLANAVDFATRAAAISVTRVGAQTSAPARAEIEAFGSELS